MLTFFGRSPLFHTPLRYLQNMPARVLQAHLRYVCGVGGISSSEVMWNHHRMV